MKLREHLSRARLRFVAAPVYVVGPAMCLAVGLVTGVGSAVLKWLIEHTHTLALGMMNAERANWMLIALPVVGIVLTGLFTHYVLHRDIEHSTDKIRDDLRRGIDYISPELMYGPIIASSLTLGFGGSAGSEGPIVSVGAAVGGNLARRLGLSDHMVRIMIACGAAAGIAGIFKAPVGGMLFALECLGMQLTTLPVIGILATCIVASLTAYVLSGCVPDLSLVRFVPQSLDYLPAVVLLGLFCGVYSIYYSRTGLGTERWLLGVSDRRVRNVVSGLTVGVLLFLFPALYGEGYAVIDKLMNTPGYTLGEYSPLYALGHLGHYGLLLIAVGLLLVKGIAAYATNSGGGVAGDFAPTLFAGAIAGYLFVTAAQTLLDCALPMPVFVLGGMAGVMAGAVRAPLMAIFITVEMTASYEYFMPVTIAGIISYGVVMLHRVMAHK
ncbi:MAG: chloride channel protein [Muribaculaceae bacterium]|nr:chloride channel protein [Muribaculaceae bacterium]